MSNLDQRTLGWKRPRTLDGRRYPLHLREYEQFDDSILPVVAELEPATFDELIVRLDDPKARAALGGWLMSAGWRGLVDQDRNPRRRGPWTYVLGPRGRTGHPRAA
jgi:hypothetical protein